jgi:hypothetical protein
MSSMLSPNFRLVIPFIRYPASYTDGLMGTFEPQENSLLLY